MTKRPKLSVLRWAAIVAFGAASALAMWFGCTQAGPQGNPAHTQGVCVADSIGTLQLLATVPPCPTDNWVCRARCFAGSAVSCLGMAFASQKNSEDAEEAVRLFHRACVLGAANACTNYAASIWAREPSDDELACARRTFEKACAAREHFACGMIGRLMLEDTTPPPFAEGRKYLEAACDDVGGFPCRVLAMHLESGKLGDYRPELVHTLLARACEGGDANACGEPATALGTFQ